MVKHPIRVSSFNVRYGAADDGINAWPKRRNLFLRTVEHMDPDILGVQECLPFQADELNMRFPHLGSVGLGRYHGVPSDWVHENYSGEHSNILYRIDRFQLLENGTRWHSDTPDVPGSMTWGNDMPRITTWAVFHDVKNDRRLSVFNTHFQWDEPYVANATKLLIADIRRCSRGLPVILTGDFNMAPDSETYRVLTDGRHADSPALVDLWQAAKTPQDNPGTSHSFTGIPEQRIDWILASSEFKPRSMKRIDVCENGVYPSDHFPLLAEIV